MIPYGKQYIDEEDIQSVIDVLKSPLITQGPLVPKFEKEISLRAGAKYSVAFNSATSALHSACLALDLSDGDYAWTVPNSFVASANCILHTGASIDFVDIDPKTKNISIEKLKKKLEDAEQLNKLPKIIIPVHFAGQPTDQEAIKELSSQYGFKILEDASHSIGAKRNGEPTGSCRWADISVFSFHPVKIVTTGEGGVATCNDQNLKTKLELYRSHGVTRNVDKEKNGEWFYEQTTLGFNFRMTDISAALGISQLQKLEYFLKERKRVALIYDNLFENLPLQTPFIEKGNDSSWHLYVINFDKELNEKFNQRKIIYENLKENGYGTNVHYIPIHLHPYFKAKGFEIGDFPNSEKYYESALSIPIFPGLKEEDQKEIVKIIRKNLL